MYIIIFMCRASLLKSSLRSPSQLNSTSRERNTSSKWKLGQWFHLTFFKFEAIPAFHSYNETHSLWKYSILWVPRPPYFFHLCFPYFLREFIPELSIENSNPFRYLPLRPINNLLAFSLNHNIPFQVNRKWKT